MSPSSIKPYTIDHLVSKRSTLRKFSHFSAPPDIAAPEGFKPHPKPLRIGLGTPNTEFFPVKEFKIKLKEFPFQDEIFGEDQETEITIDASYDEDQLLGAADALRYGANEGSAPLRNLLNDFIERVHKPNYDEWDFQPTNGSADGLHRVADALIDEGDVVLLEEFTYTPFQFVVLNNGGVPVPIKVDMKKADIDLDYLTELLENWDELRPELKGRKPKAFYTIPTCQNPTGVTQLLETRKRIYELATIHDFVIIEDDPYGYLTLAPLSKPDKSKIMESDITVEDYLENHLYPSYLKLDTVGRVIRLDSFSKVFAPGSRLGWIVAHKSFIESILKYTKLTVRAPSGLSQMFVVNVIQQKFKGVDGFLKWILKMRLAYTHRRNVLVTGLTESNAHEKGYISIISAAAGMFVSLRLNFPEGSDYIQHMEALYHYFSKYGVLVVHGFKMAVDVSFSKADCNFLRISTAPLNNDAELVEAAARISGAVLEYFDKTF